ncbi:MAG: ABC transporter permease [Lachnospiraceae bacterium]|nr:ABC transporter permease [Lachnospiraceae bacterium]
MQIFLSVWREFVRQKANLFFCIFFPSILIFVLGTILEQWNIAEYEIPDIKVAYVAEEEYPAFEQFLTKMEEQGMLTVIKEEKEAEAISRIDSEISAVLKYDAESGELILHQGANEIANRTLHILTESYSSMEDAAIICYQNGILVDMAQTEETPVYITAKKLGIERSMIDYYAVCMLVMILFMGGSIGGSMIFYDFRQSGLFRRVSVTPANKVKQFLLMVLGTLPMVVIQIAVIMFCSIFFFGAHYCVDIWGNLVLMLFFIVVALAVNAFGAVAGLLLDVNPTAVLMALNWIMMFFAGTFAKEIYIEGISNRMPMYRIQQAAFDLTLFGNYERVIRLGGIAVLCIVLFMAAGAWLFCRKKKA